MLTSNRNGWIGVDRGSGAVKIAYVRRTPGGGAAATAAVTPRWSEDDSGDVEADRCRREVDSARALLGERRMHQAAATASMSLCTLATTDDDTPTDKPVCQDSWLAGEKDRYTLSIDESEITTLCEGLRLSGLQCRVVDGAPLAIARALRLAPEGGVGLVAGLDWGMASTTFVATRSGQAVYARKLKECGFGRVIAAVAESLGLSPGEAETLVQRHGVGQAASAGGAGATVADALQHAAAPLVAEVRRTLSHLGGKLKTKPPGRIWMFGAGATPPGLAGRLGRTLGLAAEPWRPADIEITATAGAPACLFGPAIALSSLAWETA